MRKLRDYQLASIDGIRRELDRVGATLLVLPTGCGKTVVMAKLAAEWPGGNVLLLAHRGELIFQGQRKIGDELGYLPPVEKALRTVDRDFLWQGGSVVVGSVQTMIGDKRLAKYRDIPFDLIMIDEAHHATAASYRKIVDFFRAIHPNCKVVGVTATPKRADDTALGILFDSLAYELSILDAIDAGWLVPVQQEYVAVEQVDFSHLGMRKDEFGEADFKPSELQEVLVEEEALHALAGPIIDHFRERQCLIFTAGVPHAHMLADVLNRHKNGCCRAIDGKTLDQERQDAVTAFSRGELQYLANFGVFTEGFDVPQVTGVAMGRPTKSVGLYTQMLGRALRPLDGLVDPFALAAERKQAIAESSKPYALVLDFVGNSRHKLISSVDILGGNYDIETKELVKQRAKGQPQEVIEELKKAQAEIKLLREQARRKVIMGKVNYSTEEVNPFGIGATPGEYSPEVTRGGSSDAQIGFLVNLGVDSKTAAAYGKRQASAVIEKLKGERCTKKQKTILERHGFSAEVPFEQASEIIDRIARSGWTLRNEEVSA